MPVCLCQALAAALDLAGYGAARFPFSHVGTATRMVALMVRAAGRPCHIGPDFIKGV